MGIAFGHWQECDSPGREWSMWEFADSRQAPAPPFGQDPSDLCALLSYLSTASAGELMILARVAARCLDYGDWEGLPTASGGWLERRADGDDAMWRATALDFALRYRRGDRALTEGLVRLAAYDLACELAYHRGWCPHAPWDKHAADDAGCPTPFVEEPQLLIRLSDDEDGKRWPLWRRPVARRYADLRIAEMPQCRRTE